MKVVLDIIEELLEGVDQSIRRRSSMDIERSASLKRCIPMDENDYPRKLTKSKRLQLSSKPMDIELTPRCRSHEIKHVELLVDRLDVCECASTCRRSLSSCRISCKKSTPLNIVEESVQEDSFTGEHTPRKSSSPFK